jgi:hypothetical protein
MEIKFTVMLQIMPYKWYNPLVACDATRVWKIPTYKNLSILLEEKVCATNTTSR